MGQLRFSEDGISWNTATIIHNPDAAQSTVYSQSLAQNPITTITYLNNIWAAAGPSGIILKSQQGIDSLGNFNTIYNGVGITWTTQNSNFATTAITCVAYGNGQWIATGNSNQIRTSIDNGITWTTVNLTLGTSVAVKYGQDVWVVACSNAIYRSTNGINWVTSVGGGIVGNAAIQYDNNLWVANRRVGGTQIVTSTNSINWTDRNANFGSTNINSIAYGNGLWVAGGNYGQLRTSTDAITWVTRNSNFGTTIINSIAYGNGRWVAGGNTAQIRTSTDAINWVTLSTTFASTVWSIAYSNNLWIMVGGSGNLITSTNGVDWISRNANIGTSVIRSVSYGNNLWMIGGYSGQIRTSTNSPTVNINSLDSFNNRFIAINNMKSVYTSLDLENFQKRNLIIWQRTFAFSTSAVCNSIAYGNGLWVAAGGLESSLSAATIVASTNAINWVTRNSNLGNSRALSVAYGNSLWVAGGASGQLRTSTDTITWVTQTSNFGNTFILSVNYGNGLWVAGGNAGQLRTSTDTITWITQTSNFGTSAISSVAYNNGLWVVGGYSGQLRTSTNGITWVTQTSNFGTSAINSIAYGNGLWVAGGAFGQLRTSTDATTWSTRITTLSSPSILSVAYGGGRWIIGGSNGHLATSTDTVTWVTQNSGVASNVITCAYGNSQWTFGTSTAGIICTSPQYLQSLFLNIPINIHSSNANNSILVQDNANIYTYVSNSNDWQLVKETVVNDIPNKMIWTTVTSNGVGTWIMTGNNSAYVSTDLITWTTQSIPVSASVVTDIASS